MPCKFPVQAFTLTSPAFRICPFRALRILHSLPRTSGITTLCYGHDLSRPKKE